MKFPMAFGIVPRFGAGALLVLSLAFVPSPAPAAVPPEPVLAMLTTAREAAQARRWEQVAASVPGLQADLLGVYPEYWLLQPRLNQPAMPLPVSEVEQFLQRHQGSYVAQRLRRDAILAASERGHHEWVLQLAVDFDVNHAQADCAVLLARHVLGQEVAADDAMSTFSAGRACWQLYDRLVADQVLGPPQLAQQMRDAVDVDDRALALRLAGFFLNDIQRKSLAQAWEDPKPWLQRLETVELDFARRQMVVVALARLARADMLPGHGYFLDRWAARLPAADSAWVQAHFALLAALRQNPVAHPWYRNTDAATISHYNAQWRVRSALREPEPDWTWIVQQIERLPDTLRQSTAWQYWRARGLAATGQPRLAQAEFSRLATGFDFYGQLSAEELGLTITVPQPPPPPTAAEIAEARANPGLRRGIALFRLGWRAEAVPEWNYALRGMTDRQLLAAAELAREHHLYDRVVNTSERTREQHDFGQRYLAPYRDAVMAKAEEVGVDPAWMYGLIRQESRFVTQARSGVGASGLMQLMPGTARYVARRIGMTDYHPSRINDFDVNTTLGASYLNLVLEGLDGSQLLASAGYNAGPGRPKTWRNTYSGTVEGAIFAETIPFTETRDYVKKVLANAVYYTALFTGEPQSLKARLGTVSPEVAMPVVSGTAP